MSAARNSSSRATGESGRASRPVAPEAEEQHGLTQLARSRVRLGVAVGFRVAAVVQNAGPARQAHHVENQRDLAIAQDRRAGKNGNALEHAGERLDDDFLGVANRLNDQAKRPPLGLENHHVHDRFVARRRLRLDGQFAAQVDQRQEPLRASDRQVCRE